MVSHLIEPGVRFFYKKTLEGCHQVKERYYNGLYNLGLLLFLCILIGGILVFKRKTRPTLEDREKIKRKNYEYVVSKMRLFQDTRAHHAPTIVSDMPSWQNNPDVQIYDRKIYK